MSSMSSSNQIYISTYQMTTGFKRRVRNNSRNFSTTAPSVSSNANASSDHTMSSPLFIFFNSTPGFAARIAPASWLENGFESQVIDLVHNSQDFFFGAFITANPRVARTTIFASVAKNISISLFPPWTAYCAGFAAFGTTAPRVHL